MKRRSRMDQISQHANALAYLCLDEKISHLTVNVGDNGAVIWQRLDVPQLRDRETVRIENGKVERF